MFRRARDMREPTHEADTEEFIGVTLPVEEARQQNISTEECIHRARLDVVDATLDSEAAVLSTRLRGRVELAASDSFRLQQVRLRIRLRFRFHGRERAEHVLPFVADVDDNRTYRETDTGFGQVVSVETDRWDLRPHELTLFDHRETVVEGAQLQVWHLAKEQYSFDLDWPPRLPAHRPDTATLLLSPILYYRIGRAPDCEYDHLQGLGDFYVKPAGRRMVAWD